MYLTIAFTVGYTVLALNQTIHKKIDPKTHINTLAALLPLLRPRPGILLLKRLTVVLDESSEKGFGLVRPLLSLPPYPYTNILNPQAPSSASLLASYDLLSLLPTTSTSFSLACLSHTAPSAHTAHIISLPLTLPRLPFHLKHTQVRAALKNGVVFEIGYAGALGDLGMGGVGGGGGGEAGKRNWWAAAREVVRVTKGKGIVLGGGASEDASLRAPRDVANLCVWFFFWKRDGGLLTGWICRLVMLGMAQDAANDAATKTCRSLVLRARMFCFFSDLCWEGAHECLG